MSRLDDELRNAFRRGTPPPIYRATSRASCTTCPQAELVAENDAAQSSQASLVAIGVTASLLSYRGPQYSS